MNTCSNCQTQNNNQAQFCVNCGQPLNQAALAHHEHNSGGKMSGSQVQVGGDDDIYQVVASTLASPIAGVAKAIQLIAKKAQA